MVSTNFRLQRRGWSLLGAGLMVLGPAAGTCASEVFSGVAGVVDRAEPSSLGSMLSARDGEPIWEDDMEIIIVIILEILGPHFRVEPEAGIESQMREVIAAYELYGIPSTLSRPQRAELHMNAIAGQSLVAAVPLSQQTSTLSEFDMVLSEISSGTASSEIDSMR